MVFIRSLRLCEKGHRYGYKDKDTGEIVIAPLYENGKEYPIVIDKRNYLAVKYYGKWGLINTNNEVVVDFRYEDIGRPKLKKGSPEFVLCFQQHDDGYYKIGIISRKLHITMTPILDYFPENITVLGENTCWYYICKGEKWGAIKTDGTVVMELEYTKEEVNNQITKQCENLILEYKNHKEDIPWTRNVMRSRDYLELFEWE